MGKYVTSDILNNLDKLLQQVTVYTVVETKIFNILTYIVLRKVKALIFCCDGNIERCN